MIQAKNLKKVYKTKGGVIVNALDGVSVKLPDTGMVFILGKSGSGKSTLLNVLGGLDSFDSGEIIIKGCSAKDFKQTHYDSYRNTYIGFIFQEYNVLEELTVGANVALAIELQGRKATNEEINKILCEVDLEGYGARKPNELSGGQKQRVAIARALVKNPEIIMADEPTGALDSATGRQVFDTLKKLSKDKLVLIVSHDREFSEQYADRIIELKDGVIISDVEKSEEAYEQEQTEQENISYSGNEIKIEKGYFLTEEDRIAINKYLSEINDGVTVSVSEKNQGKKISSADFIPTDESKIKSEKDDNFRLIKSKLSLKNAFKLGSGGLKHKKFRLVFTIFLSVISFLLFGLADTIAAYNNIQTATQSIYDTGVNYASYVKSLKHTWGDDEDDFYWSNDGALLSAADMQKITEATGGKIVGVFSRVRDLNFGESLGSLDEDKHNLSAVYSQGFSGVTAINQQILGELGLELVGEKSRLPQEEKNEIVVPLFIYDLFAYTGYAQKTDNGQVDVEIKNPEDLIGKTLNISLKQVQGMYGGEISSNEEYTIVGILDTKFDYERYKALLDINAELTLSTIEYMALTQELYSAREYSLACVGFVSPDKLEGLVDKATNGPQYFNGNLTIFDLKNSNIVNSIEDIWENYENITNQYNYQNVIKLDKIQDDVLWLGNSLETLGDNQIIISLELYNSLMNSDLYSGGKEDILHTENVTFTDFEQIAFNKINNLEWNTNRFSTLYGLVNCAETLSYYKYAWSNIETVRSLVVQYYVDNEMCTPEDADSISNDQIINEYVRYTTEGIFENPVDRAYMEGYREEIISKYNLSDYFLTKAERAKLMATVTHEGETFTANASVETKSELSMNYVSIFLRKYAYENPTDVVNYYNAVQSGNGKEQLVGVRFDSMAEMYVNFLRGKYFDIYYSEKSEVDYEPQSDVNVVKYVNSSYAQLINSTAGKDQLPKFTLYADNYRGKQEFLRNVEIVGVNVGSYTETVTVGPKFYNFLVGSSEGGIFSFATGKMPTDINQIGDIVKYTKTYENEGARYDLKNNVTEQLDMVDEILEILGQVFLYVGIGFAVFASLMLSNFIGTSVAHKKQEIGILRAIGSRSADVFRIFFAESFIIAMINFVLSATLTLAACIVLNGVLRNEAGILITFLSFGVRQIGLLLLVSIGVAFLATFFPVRKIASKKPIDAIKNRK